MGDGREKDSEVGCWSCADDPDRKLEQMFVDVVQAGRIRKGQYPARRPVFLKPHGVAHGRFEVRADLPDELRVGVFALGARPAWVRFSSDTTPDRSDLRTTCGIGIKLFDVPGPKLLGDGETQDFILQNHDVFFVDDAEAMCAFTRAGVIDGDYDPYLASHPTTRRILDEMQKIELSALTAVYWSVLPYAFGKGLAVKYKLEPEAQADGTVAPNDPDYLASDLRRRLGAGEARFRFMVQRQTDPSSMPLDRATVRWSEELSPPIHVATLVLPRQDIDAAGQASYGENLAFNPWHSLPEHEPLGSISHARRRVYAASSERRRNVNGIPTREPSAARPIDAQPQPSDDCIVRAAIHPSIGVARVGSAAEAYLLGPEVIDPPPTEPGAYRDEEGALKRQAARFRIYGLNAEGVAVRELTEKDAEITWTVHLANRKSSWYQFQLALDIPEARSAPPTLLRNANVVDRDALTIDPGRRSVSGCDTRGPAFDSGTFMGNEVYLGELRTDDEGRLIVLGGRGRSASYDGSKAVTFANNEGWHDDVSDGPVTATVRLGTKELKVDPAWVVVAPPNYAPLQKSVRTMWDLMRDVAIGAGMLPRPVRPSFDGDIRPIFERMSRLQWVNAGFAATFGHGGPNDFCTPEWLGRLCQAAPTARELRRNIANQFRVFDRDAWSPAPWPWVYGDAMNIPPAQTPRQHSVLSDTQMRFLAQWAEGDFEEDYDPLREPPRTLDALPVRDQPAMLDRASLEFCLADAFHPGCEMTWPVRHASMYASAFRFRHAEPGSLEPEYGPQIDAGVLGLPEGPLGPQRPGGITRWMAVPWQTDTASCRSGYTKTYDPYVPTFWPARVPNEVLTRDDYEIVMDEGRSMGERMAAFARRADWVRGLGKKSYTDQINNMIERFGELGVVVTREGPRGSSHFPSVMEVEDLPEPAAKLLRAQMDADKDAPEVDLSGIEKVRRFVHGLR